jgi:hypothetical protein
MSAIDLQARRWNAHFFAHYTLMTKRRCGNALNRYKNLDRTLTTNQDFLDILSIRDHRLASLSSL